MKYSLTLNQAELSQAVADFVAKKVGVEAEVKVTFDIEISVTTSTTASAIIFRQPPRMRRSHVI